MITTSELTQETVRYAGFWKRICSHILDIIFLSPMAALGFFFYNSKEFNYIIILPGILLGLFYQVYLVQKYGGTPGKKLLKIEIRKLDLSQVTYKEALLRYSVIFSLSLIQQVSFLIGISKISDFDLAMLSYTEFALKIAEISPQSYTWVTNAMSVWGLSEFIVIFFNQKKRAPHDFIAGTVVIESQS